MLRKRGRGWGGGERRDKEGGSHIQESIISTFAVAIATPILHFELYTLHFVFRTLYPLLLSFVSRLLYSAFPTLPLHVSVA